MLVFGGSGWWALDINCYRFYGAFSDPNGPEPNIDQVQSSNDKELLLSKVSFDGVLLEYGLHGPFNSPNGCTLLSVTNYLNED